MNALVHLCIDTERSGVEICAISRTERMFADKARNHLAEEVLKTGCTHVLWLDDDTLPPPDAVLRLAELKKPMVSGLYFGRNDPYPISYRRREGETTLDSYVEEEPYQVDVAGFGCLLMTSALLGSIEEPRFSYSVESDEGVAFCDKAKEMSYEIWVEPSVLCGHIGAHRVVTVRDFIGKYK